MKRRIATVLALVLLVLVSGSSRADAPTADAAGKWSGTWRDTGTGHHGPLHARIVRVNDCTYRATFHGRFRRVIPFIYSLDLHVNGRDGDTLLLTGQLKMPLFGQSMDLTARVSACAFDATFCSAKYHGKFELTRSR